MPLKRTMWVVHAWLPQDIWGYAWGSHNEPWWLLSCRASIDLLHSWFLALYWSKYTVMSSSTSVQNVLCIVVFLARGEIGNPARSISGHIGTLAWLQLVRPYFSRSLSTIMPLLNQSSDCTYTTQDRLSNQPLELSFGHHFNFTLLFKGIITPLYKFFSMCP